MVSALRFCLPLEIDFSDLAFLLSGLGGLFEGNSCSVNLEYAGICVLVSLMSAARVSNSFQNIILFRRHQFSSWLRLKLTSLSLSLSIRPYLPYRLEVMRFTHTSIFLSSYDRSRCSNSRIPSPYQSYQSESSCLGMRAGAKVQVALSSSICRICSLTCLLRDQNSLIRWSICAQLTAHCELAGLWSSLYFSFSYWSSRVSVQRCTSRTTLMRLVNLTQIPSTRQASLPTVAPMELAQKASGDGEEGLGLPSDRLEWVCCLSQQRCRQEF